MPSVAGSPINDGWALSSMLPWADRLNAAPVPITGVMHRSPPSVASRASLLIVSNGYGEDAVGRALAAHLTSDTDIVAFPLVGRGTCYQDLPLLEPRCDFPSGGFALRGSWRWLWADLREGALRHWQAQRKTLREQKGRHHGLIAVGDVYCLWMAAHALTPVVFVATAKSEYNERHRAVERLLMRRLARVVFVRDAVTADTLASQGIRARHLGNPLMDTITFAGTPLVLKSGNPTVTLLPGSRADAYANLALMLRLCARVGHQVNVNWLCTRAPQVTVEGIRETARKEGWVATGDILRSDATEVHLTRAFGEALQAADLVVGLAGTANEQAAGLGKPIVAFPGPGSQFSRRFLTLQAGLLGDAVIATAGWQDASDAVLRLLEDPTERARRGLVGCARMGSRGAIGKIAGEVRVFLQTSAL